METPALTVKVNVVLAVLPTESVTVSWICQEPVAVGVPLTRPVELRVKPSANGALEATMRRGARTAAGVPTLQV